MAKIEAVSTPKGPGGITCATCRYFSTSPAECRRKSPLGTLVGGPGGQPAVIGFWPSTRPEGWCGEHERDPLKLS